MFESWLRGHREEKEDTMPQQPVPVLPWSVSISRVQGCNVIFWIEPTAGVTIPTTANWGAQLYVWAKNLPSLMKDGFHWDRSNVREEEGSFGGKKLVPWLMRREKWQCGRFYTLEDTADEPRWFAHLYVCANDFSVLAGFKLADISVENVARAIAWNEESQVVYQFSVLQPAENCNAYYDDRPLEGFWPWPKNGEAFLDEKRDQQIASEGGEATSTSDFETSEGFEDAWTDSEDTRSDEEKSLL